MLDRHPLREEWTEGRHEGTKRRALWECEREKERWRAWGGKERLTRREWVREMLDHPGVPLLQQMDCFWMVHCQLQVWSSEAAPSLWISNLDERVDAYIVSLWWLIWLHWLYLLYGVESCPGSSAEISSIFHYDKSHKRKEGLPDLGQNIFDFVVFVVLFLPLLLGMRRFECLVLPTWFCDNS